MSDKPTREEAVRVAGERLYRAGVRADSLTVRQAAEAAWVPGGPSVEELEDMVRADRAKRGAS